MQTGIFGGTFNPPHAGHALAAKEAKQLLALDRLIFLPAGDPPHKTLPPGSPTAEDRLAMVRIMADGLGADYAVEPMELQREGPSYTVDSLRLLHRQYPEDRFFLLMGADMFCTLDRWRQPEEIFSLCTPVGFSRTDGEGMAELETAARTWESRYGGETRLLTLPQVLTLSSSEARECLSRPDAARQAETLLPLPVYGYILRKGLYGLSVDLQRLSDRQLRAVAYSMMRAKRIPHADGTERTAEELARFWGANPLYARRGGILHDCTKYYTRGEHLKLCAQYGVALDGEDALSDKFLHAKTAGALAKYVFGEPQEVSDAIFCHTTGKPQMKLLDKILYLADYMEPNRDFAGVEILRELVWKDLDDAMICGMEMTVEEMKERGARIHPATLAALTELKEKKWKKEVK